MSDLEEANTELYAIYAEAQGHDKPLLQLELTFSRLIDDIIVPYQTNDTFFIDGAPVNPDKLIRIKVLKLSSGYLRAKRIFDSELTRAGATRTKIFGEQYSIRLEHTLRQHSEDVTSQVLKAFNQANKPSIKDYLPKREELISGAMKLFIESIKALN